MKTQCPQTVPPPAPQCDGGFSFPTIQIVGEPLCFASIDPASILGLRQGYRAAKEPLSPKGGPPGNEESEIGAWAAAKPYLLWVRSDHLFPKLKN